MDLKQLSYFVRVAELGGFTRASVALGIAQPALSRQVRMLEVELHQNLFERNGRGVTLTEGGIRLLEHSRGILYQVERMQEDLNRLHSSPSGSVILGLPPSLARRLTIPVSRAFRQQWPEARLSIREGLSLAMREAMCNGRLDVALLYGAQRSTELEEEHLMDEELFAVVPRRDRSLPAGPEDTASMSIKQLAQCPLVVASRPNELRTQLERYMITAGYVPNIAMEVDGVPAILELVLEGIGFAVLPAHAVRSARQPEHFMLQRIGSGLIAQVWLASPARRALMPTQQALMNLLRSQVSMLCAAGTGK